MSLSLLPLKTVQTLDPLTKINSSRAYAVLRGGSTVTYQPFIALNSSPSNVNFSCNPPSPGIIVDRTLYMLWAVQLTFTGTSASGPLLQIGSTDAPRAFPIAQSINTSAFTINNANVSIDTNKVINMLLRYSNPRDVSDRDYSLTPSMLDQFQNYSEGLGMVKSPLGLYGNNGYEDPRGGFVGIDVISNPSGGGTLTSVVNLYMAEPIFLAPWTFGGEQEAGFVGVQTLSASFQLNNLSRLWSHDAVNGNPLSTISAAFLETPQLLFKFITPSELVKIPEVAVYPYFVVNYYATDFGSLAPNASVSATSNNVQFQGIPTRVMVAGRQRDSDLTNLTSDTFAAINTVTIQFNGVSGILSSATQRDLYNISRKNGVNMSWNQWSYYVGSVLALDMGLDIGLTPLQAAGMIGTFNFQITVNFTNVNQLNTISFTLYIIAINEGTFSLSGNQSLAQTNILTPPDVLDASSKPMVDYSQVKAVIKGGNFFSSLKSLVDKYLPIAKSAFSVGKQAYELAKPVYEQFRTAKGSGRTRGRGLDWARYQDDSDSEDDECRYVSRSGLIAI